jgi:hypothetical protein
VKLELDENLPASAASRLAALGYDVHTVLDESLDGKHDAVVWTAAQAEGRSIRSKGASERIDHPSAPLIAAHLVQGLPPSRRRSFTIAGGLELRPEDWRLSGAHRR